MSNLMPPYPLIRDGLNQSLVIPFLGSGASLGDRKPGECWEIGCTHYLPTAKELARFLAHKTEFPQDKPLQLPAEHLRIFQDYLQDYLTPDLAKVAQYCDVVGGRSRLRRELHPIFDQDYPLTPLHHFLAEVRAPLLIVTTNYDDLIERAFDEKGRAYHLVIHGSEESLGDQVLWQRPGASKGDPITPNKLDIDLTADTVVYKMHGAVNRQQPDRDQYVITEDDYIDFLARMTRKKAIPAIFAEPFQHRHFLFLGYGLSDWNLRVVLRRVERDLRRPKDTKSWAIQLKPSALERRFWQEHGVEVYEMSIDEFVKELSSR